MIRKDIISDNLLDFTSDQLNILFNLENIKIVNDIKLTKNVKAKNLKIKWHNLWLEGISKCLPEIVKKENVKFSIYTEEEIIEFINRDEDSSWFPVAVTELILFTPYFKIVTELLDDDTEIENNREFRKLNFNSKISNKYFDNLFSNVNQYNSGDIYKIIKVYNQEYNRENTVLQLKLKSKNIFIWCLICLSIFIVFMSPIITIAFISNGLNKARTVANLFLLISILLIFIFFCISSTIFYYKVMKNNCAINRHLRFSIELKMYNANNKKFGKKIDNLVSETVKYL